MVNDGGWIGHEKDVRKKERETEKKMLLSCIDASLYQNIRAGVYAHYIEGI